LANAQFKAARAVNHALVNFYWEFGKELIEKQKAFQWGEHFLDQISHDMQTAFPGMKGFSRTNLVRMRKFASLYPDNTIGAQAVHQLAWGHIVHLIQRVEQDKPRNWYAEQSLENGWSRSILEMQIDSQLYERQAKSETKLSNFHKHLPSFQSDLAHQMLKDPYNFDFMTIHGKTYEREVETGLTAHIRDFLLELGQGFAFVGSQVPLTIDGREFSIDLLFYHTHLHCYVVIELKATDFKPEHTGQLGFYLAAADDLIKREGDNQTIGILLCKSKSKIIAEYALSSINAPIGISEYELSKAIPEEFISSLPSIEEIEAELNRKIKMHE
jgi:predicted nuclease of restriction endonuclease-like (RecB) superfamily